ncbi:MAG: pyridoxamine kinase [Eubacteriales bacterium]
MKKIAVITDLSGFGRCSITVALPIISALGVQCCPVPTSILSSHTGFENIFFDDYSSHTKTYMDKWEQMNLTFDGYLTGFFASATQIDDVYHLLKEKDKTMIVVDPIMGDQGKLYSSYTEEMVCSLKNLCGIADVLLPNLTEACILTDTPYVLEEITEEVLVEICNKLAKHKTKYICITGIVQGDEIMNFLYMEGMYEVIKVPQIGEVRCGTGDVFASIVSAGLVQGKEVTKCVCKATDYIGKTLEVSLSEPITNGICFEKTLLQIGDFE